jgi:hypothetical protein
MQHSSDPLAGYQGRFIAEGTLGFARDLLTAVEETPMQRLAQGTYGELRELIGIRTVGLAPEELEDGDEASFTDLVMATAYGIEFLLPGVPLFFDTHTTRAARLKVLGMEGDSVEVDLSAAFAYGQDNGYSVVSWGAYAGDEPKPILPRVEIVTHDRGWGDDYLPRVVLDLREPREFAFYAPGLDDILLGAAHDIALAIDLATAVIVHALVPALPAPDYSEEVAKLTNYGLGAAAN